MLALHIQSLSLLTSSTRPCSRQLDNRQRDQPYCIALAKGFLKADRHRQLYQWLDGWLAQGVSSKSW